MLFTDQLDPETYFSRIYNPKRGGLDPAVTELCEKMRIDPAILLPK